MKKTIMFLLVVFAFALLYVHLKVLVYVEAYQINDQCTTLNKLVDARDDLVYNFSKKTRICTVAGWAQENNFSLPDNEKVVVLNIEKERKPQANETR